MRILISTSITLFAGLLAAGRLSAQPALADQLRAARHALAYDGLTPAHYQQATPV